MKILKNSYVLFSIITSFNRELFNIKVAVCVDFFSAAVSRVVRKLVSRRRIESLLLIFKYFFCKEFFLDEKK